MSLFPIFLKLARRPCLLVGAGEIALQKIPSLLSAEARVRVIAPRVAPHIVALAEEGRLELHRREFQPADLENTFLVVAATDNPEVNAAIYEEAVARNVLCNSVDDPPHCDFYFGSVVTRGDLQIAISTAGESPALAQRLRREIDEQLPADLGPWLRDLGHVRRNILATYAPGEDRKLLLHQLAQRHLCDPQTCPTQKLALKAQSLDKGSPRMQQGTKKGIVYLVGAGPGNPDLLTVKAARLLATADIVLNDDLVPPTILALANPRGLTVGVGKRCGEKKITQEDINQLMIEKASQGLSVVRLKSGDPLVFGRAAEEMDALRAAGIPFEVVPGITAAFAAAAALECSLTDRRASSSIVFSSGHHAPTPRTQAGPARITEPTRIVYMPGRDFSALASEWAAAGLPASYPCIAISHAAQPDQQITMTTLGALSTIDPGPAPVLLLAGWVFQSIRIDAPEFQPLLESLIEDRPSVES
jgi:uroporphyrin-III C-methyltransferase / precorrin-2 dehydrogenase / sirohydrochlorin ferrochelatase